MTPGTLRHAESESEVKNLEILHPVTQNSKFRKTTKRKKGQIGFSVTRGGEIAGEHTVSFIGANDRVDLTHKANNRSIVVNGAIEAAIFLSSKKNGFFDMSNLFIK